MRLGDLDALKEKFIERLDEGFFLYSEIMSIIDNAPTVRTGDCEDCPYCPNSNSGIPIGVE